jgi:hypothetical protein
MYTISRPTCILLFIIITVIACSRHVDPSGTGSSLKKTQSSVPSPPCIIYKTKADYSKNIPVILSDDQARILSYPDVKDVFFKGDLAYPTVLNEGFLLDNRGIGPNVAFLSVTYEQYSKMVKTPSSDELFKLIIDRDPLMEMIQCGYRSNYTDIVKEVNELISSGKINTCKKLK